jgi:hypothetical protein
MQKRLGTYKSKGLPSRYAVFGKWLRVAENDDDDEGGDGES